MTSLPALLDTPDDLYRVQRRPHHAQVAVNDGRRGLALFDPRRASIDAHLPFPSGYPTQGGIDAVLMRADGNAAMVFRDDPAGAAWFDLANNHVTPAVHPPWDDTASPAFDWRGESLWLADSRRSGFAK